MIKLLFVCTGNICRSPTAEGVMRQLIAQKGLENKITADSAGTEHYHIGDSPDRRSVQTAKQRGYALHDLVARQVQPADFHDFHFLFALDRGHERLLKRKAPAGTEGKIHLFLEYAGVGGEVPDPYYGGPEHFDQVLDLVEAGCRETLKKVLALPPRY